MDTSGKVRINFVQILGKYYLEEIKPKLDGPSTAALRRAFIDKVFSALQQVFTKPLPSQVNAFRFKYWYGKRVLAEMFKCYILVVNQLFLVRKTKN